MDRMEAIMDNKLIAAYADVKILWVKMCKHDGIDPTAKFVTFSETNPYAARYNEAMAAYMNLAQTAKKAGR